MNLGGRAMERSRPSSPRSSSSSSFLNSDHILSFQPTHDSFFITPYPQPHHQVLPPPHFHHGSLDVLYPLPSWGDGPSHHLPPPHPFISFGSSPGIHQISHDEARKKMHREIERQRRQGMNSLFCSLRSLLPLESIKHHLGVAFDYINGLRLRIKSLEAKRDKLQRNSSFVPLIQESSSSSSSEACPVNCFTVHPYLDGLEVMIRGEFSEQHFPLSRVLRLLAHEGVSVANCMYTRNNDITMYTIKSEACDPGSFDIAGLQWKLGELLNL